MFDFFAKHKKPLFEGLCDIHNHLLPGIDDGSKSTDISLEMLTIAQAQGITEVVNTVHFQHPKMNNKEIDYSDLSNSDEIKQNLSNIIL